ncbi:MAG: hypothetical protein KAT32_03525 [Candidatus Moranbacteria bacterium]|nr:hypothetical protein [Candidatus Moranbacteria bacterium]
MDSKKIFGQKKKMVIKFPDGETTIKPADEKGYHTISGTVETHSLRLKSTENGYLLKGAKSTVAMSTNEALHVANVLAKSQGYKIVSA